MKKILLLLLTLIFLPACDVQQSEPEIPNKPIEVPDKAFWVGGLDGGVFVLIEKNKNLEANEYLGEIYYVSGDIAYKGKMSIFPKDNAIIDYMNPRTYQAGMEIPCML
ncbi:hypothetical protein [Pseudoalteromonas sp.]|uniref:hypothetical protein n=1 Tax=Pseudoalteromonas sp. TaxID=53249 RepID=UPI003566D64F